VEVEPVGALGLQGLQSENVESDLVEDLGGRAGGFGLHDTGNLQMDRVLEMPDDVVVQIHQTTVSHEAVGKPLHQGVGVQVDQLCQLSRDDADFSPVLLANLCHRFALRGSRTGSCGRRARAGVGAGSGCGAGSAARYGAANSRAGTFSWQ
jgi:hypothetical protein